MRSVANSPSPLLHLELRIDRRRPKTTCAIVRCALDFRRAGSRGAWRSWLRGSALRPLGDGELAVATGACQRIAFKENRCSPRGEVQQVGVRGASSYSTGVGPFQSRAGSGSARGDRDFSGEAGPQPSRSVHTVGEVVHGADAQEAFIVMDSTFVDKESHQSACHPLLLPETSHRSCRLSCA